MKTETLINAVEQNDFAFFAAMKASPAITVYDEDKALYCRSKIPFGFFNCTKRLNCSYEEAGVLMDDAVAYAQRSKLPVMWYTGPSTHPAEAGKMLTERGFKVEEKPPGMAVDLAALPETKGGNFTIEHMLSDDSLADWRRIFQQSFDLSSEATDGFIDFHRALGFCRESPAQHFLARVGDEPAGIATVFLGAGAAGIYNIATLDAYRGHGIGREMTLATMALGRAKGFRVGVLTATDAGLPLYQKLGFREVCKIGIYTYAPEK